MHYCKPYFACFHKQTRQVEIFVCGYWVQSIPQNLKCICISPLFMRTRVAFSVIPATSVAQILRVLYEQTRHDGLIFALTQHHCSNSILIKMNTWRSLLSLSDDVILYWCSLWVKLNSSCIRAVCSSVWAAMAEEEVSGQSRGLEREGERDGEKGVREGLVKGHMAAALTVWPRCG